MSVVSALANVEIWLNMIGEAVKHMLSACGLSLCDLLSEMFSRLIHIIVPG